jgi:hypothetical protein
MAETGVRIPVAVLKKSSVAAGLFVVNGFPIGCVDSRRLEGQDRRSPRGRVSGTFGASAGAIATPGLQPRVIRMWGQMPGRSLTLQGLRYQESNPWTSCL